MAATPVNPRTNHVRSISLPSRSHPIVPRFDECLCRMHSSESVSASSIRQRIDGLKDLYDCVHSILVLSSTQQALFLESQNSELVNELLDGLLRLLDLCTAAKEALSTAKNHKQELQSALRRRRGDECVLSEEIKKYLSHRMKVKMATQKSLRNLKLTEAKSFPLMSENRESAVVISMLKEVESATFAVLESLMSFTQGQRSNSKTRIWSLVSKLMRTKRVACEGASKLNEVAQVDAELEMLMNLNTTTCRAQKGLQELEMSMQDLEEGQECLYRQLIRTRATLLNIVSC